MSDLVARLRNRIYETLGRDNIVIESPDDMCHEAADRIEALQSELAEARAETALYRNAAEPLEKERDYEHDRAERLNLELTDARVENEALKAVVEAARPIMSQNGPVTFSKEWQQAWEVLDDALAALDAKDARHD